MSRKQCDVIGSEMSKWYFEFGGLLMSGKARDAYFRLARALTRASLAANELDVPEFPVDAENISKEKLKNYREQLGTKLSLGRAKTWVKRYDVDEWTFGKSSPKGEGEPYMDFKDYVFLQELSSLLRTELSTDLHSRRRLS